jgi:hypothetical protein
MIDAYRRAKWGDLAQEQLRRGLSLLLASRLRLSTRSKGIWDVEPGVDEEDGVGGGIA